MIAKEIREILGEVREHINSEMNCLTPEYWALYKLERVISLLAQEVFSLDSGLHRIAKETLCSMNGIGRERV